MNETININDIKIDTKTKIIFLIIVTIVSIILWNGIGEYISWQMSGEMIP